MRTRWETTVENGQLCRAAQKTSRTRPLGTTAGVAEDSPGDCGTGRLLTGTNGDSFPGDNLPPESGGASGRRIRLLPLSSPLLSSPPALLSSAFGSARETRTETAGYVAAKRVGFIPVVRLFVPTVNKTETLSDHGGVHYGSVGAPKEEMSQ